MKNQIISILSWPYPDRYVVKVFRGDTTHITSHKVYVADYTNSHSAYRLARRFSILNALLQYKLIKARVEETNGKINRRQNIFGVN